ncbi:MAG: hypothetical protein RLY78_3640 [Pseudomonadota bacterium]|jgi:glycosyltransferase involved in cell wall biosynthesis
MSRTDTASPRVSVVIPVYNGERFIARAIDSVLAQSHPVADIVVVNDGSHDGTAEVLRHYGDRLTVIDVPNGGVAQARNLGLARTRGELIALLDADDVWRAHKLSAQIDALRRHPDVDFTCCDYEAVHPAIGPRDTHFEHVRRLHPPVFNRVVPRPVRTLIDINFVGTCSNVLFRRSLLGRVGLFDPRLRQAEDYDLWLRMATTGNFYLQSDVLLEKITHDDNLTLRYDETLQYHEAVLHKFHAQQNELFARDPGLQAAHTRAVADVRYQIAGLLLAKGQRREGFDWLGRSWQADRGLRHSLRCLKRLLRRTLLP